MNANLDLTVIGTFNTQQLADFSQIVRAMFGDCATIGAMHTPTLAITSCINIANEVAGAKGRINAQDYRRAIARMEAIAYDILGGAQ